jgi:type VI secretion system protein ImpE
VFNPSSQGQAPQLEPDSGARAPFFSGDDMSSALDLKGRSLAETLAELQNRVRTAPGDAKLRTFLFQLLATLGQWDRALSQLSVAGELDPGALAMVQMYGDAVKAEALRAEVFAGRRSPVVFGEPEEWVALVIEALKASGEGRQAAASELRARAFEKAPVTSGRVITADMKGVGDDPPAGEAFEWLADGDSRVGPMIEATVLGRYWWIPIHRIRRMHVEPPTDLRDLVWCAVHFEWANGGEGYGLVPTRYPGSEAAEDDSIRLSRRTEWNEVSEGAYHGLGQRMLATNAGEYSLLEIRRVEFDTAAPSA